MTRILLVGNINKNCLESSYDRAFSHLGCIVKRFDILSSIKYHARLGRLGRIFNEFVPVEPWIRKVNRDLVLEASQVRPDIMITFGHYPIRVGGLAQVRSSCTTKLVHIWPDPFQNWSTHLTACLPLFDLVATYSIPTVEIFKLLGAPRAKWVPFAGDPLLHSPVEIAIDERAEYGADVSFVGGWRPEREAALSRLRGFRLKIWGPDWGRRCKKNDTIMRAWQGRGAYGEEFAKVVACSKINLNVIEATNYPAANMRFFEIPMAGGFQLASPCPEQESIFREGEHLAIYRSFDELPALVSRLLEDEQGRQRMATASHHLLTERYTYAHRAYEIIEALK